MQGQPAFMHQTPPAESNDYMLSNASDRMFSRLWHHRITTDPSARSALLVPGGFIAQPSRLLFTEPLFGKADVLKTRAALIALGVNAG